MRFRLGLSLGVAAVIVVPSHALHAQTSASQSEVRYIGVTSFNVPYGEANQQVGLWIDSVSVPLARLNPHVLSYRVAQHNYGANAGDWVIITEYGSWEAIEADCGEPCATWVAENQPEEGTPRAEKWDKIQATFLKYYSDHRDELYAAPMRRAK